jgi:hypothetical protein
MIGVHVRRMARYVELMECDEIRVSSDPCPLGISHESPSPEETRSVVRIDQMRLERAVGWGGRGDPNLEQQVPAGVLSSFQAVAPHFILVSGCSSRRSRPIPA